MTAFPSYTIVTLAAACRSEGTVSSASRVCVSCPTMHLISPPAVVAPSIAFTKTAATDVSKPVELVDASGRPIR